MIPFHTPSSHDGGAYMLYYANLWQRGDCPFVLCSHDWNLILFSIWLLRTACTILTFPFSPSITFAYLIEVLFIFMILMLVIFILSSRVPRPSGRERQVEREEDRGVGGDAGRTYPIFTLFFNVAHPTHRAALRLRARHQRPRAYLSPQHL